MAKGKLNVLYPSNAKKGKFKPTGLYFDGYLDLFTTIESLLNVCILATQGEDHDNINIKQYSLDLCKTLELANKLMPFEEGEFLDKAYEVFVKKK